MAFTPITVGESLGLQAKPKDYTNQIIGAQKLRRQEDALKRKGEEEEFAKLADIKIDYSKYHRIDRPRVKQMYASYLNEMNKLYKEGNPNWKNAAYEKGNDLKFAIEQVAVDSKVKFDAEKYVTDPTTKKSNELMEYYNWLNQGDFNNPPKIQPDAYGQITAFDPTTGTIGFVSGKNYNLPTLAEKSVFDPALAGYVTDPNSVTSLTDGYKNVTQRAEYNPVMIEGAIASLVKTQEFNGWRIDNAERIRKSATANPDTPPEEVMYTLWAEDIMNLEPTKTQEYRLSPRQSFNINLPQTEKPEYSTKFTTISNVLRSEINSGEISYERTAMELGGTIGKTPDGKATNVKIPIPEKAVGIPQVVQGSRLFINKEGSIVKAPQKGYTTGIPFEQQVRFGTIKSDGSYTTYRQEQIDKMSPNERKKLQPILLVAYKPSADPLESRGRSIEDFNEIKESFFFVAYNLSEGSFDLSDLNNQYPELYENTYRKTSKEMGKDPSKSATSPKLTEQKEEQKPTKKKLY